MEKLLEESGIVSHTERDHLLIEPWEIFKGSDPSVGYQVFTPFSKRWLELFKTREIKARVEAQAKKTGGDRFRLRWKDLKIQESHVLDEVSQSNSKIVSIALPKSGPREALRVLRGFTRRISKYASQRDFPAVPGPRVYPFTSRTGV